jgi:hypothetical protein
MRYGIIYGHKKFYSTGTGCPVAFNAFSSLCLKETLNVPGQSVLLFLFSGIELAVTEMSKLRQKFDYFIKIFCP